MGLKIVHAADEGIASESVRAALVREQELRGAVLLVPSFEAQLEAERKLSAVHEEKLFGLPVTTISAWLKERWEVWGDGTHLIEPAARTIAMEQVLLEEAEGVGALSFNAGTLNVLIGLASKALPWLPLESDGTPDSSRAEALGLTPAEAAAAGIAGRYRALIHKMGYIEEAEAAAGIVGRLCDAGAKIPAFVVSGMRSLGRWQRELVLSLAEASEVVLILPCMNAAADAEGEELAQLLRDAADERGIAWSMEDGGGCPSPSRAPELAQLLGQIFEPGEPLCATGAVELLRPAGPLAEAELVTRRIQELVEKEGAASICVAVPSTERAWRELAPKLSARGIAVRTRISCPLAKLEAGRAFIEYAETVASLDEMAQSWPLPTKAEDGSTLVNLGDMGWWPPRELSDFLLSDIAHMPVSKVQRIDAKWRGDRLLTPQEVLTELQSPKTVSKPVAQATMELLRGRIGTAASKLLAPYVAGGEPVPDDVATDDMGDVAIRVPRFEDHLSDAEAEGVLAGILNLAGTLKELGITADPKAEKRTPLAAVVALMKQAMQQTSAVVRPEVALQGAKAQVTIVSRSEAAQMEPCSCDAVILCGETSAEAAVATGDDVLSALLERCGVEPAPNPMQERRAGFWHAVAAASSHLIVERTQKDSDAEACYPSVMLSELLSCYRLKDDKAEDLEGCREQGMPVFERSELSTTENLSWGGSSPCLEASEPIGPTGAITEGHRDCVVVPPTGRTELLDGRPLLSASQIESYLECPYKWFSLRRLGLGDCDAGFSSMEMGTFAHRVLEVTHRQLLDEVLDEAERATGMRPDVAAEPWLSVRGSRVTLEDAAGLAHAKEILSQVFDTNLDRQRMLEHKQERCQPFVPHTEEEQGLVTTLKRDLLSELDYESGLFQGFEPRHFEWSFGRKGELIPYAGAWLTGTIDRVDVDAHHQAVVIDYKHMSPAGFAKKYAAFPQGAPEPGAPLALPRRVQSLIYGQVIRRKHPELKVVAAVYLGSRGDHAISGAASENVYARVFGAHQLSSRSEGMVIVPDHEGFGRSDEEGMCALLDSCEELIAAKIAELLDGNIEANPIDADACKFCPVLNCEKRMK